MAARSVQAVDSAGGHVSQSEHTTQISVGDVSTAGNALLLLVALALVYSVQQHRSALKEARETMGKAGVKAKHRLLRR